jgi:methylthioribose-1-phosphate isomerase
MDVDTARGSDVDIEDRGPAEVLGFGATPDGANAVNPAFDVTPYHLVTAIITDERVITP